MTFRYSPNKKYRLGIAGGGFDAFTDQNDDASFGYNIGITNEFKIGKYLALTASLEFGLFSYELRLNEFDQDILNTYPISPNIPPNVNVIFVNQHAHSFNLPIGLKWYFKEYPHKNRLFLQSNVVFQYYYIQKFEFTFTEPVGGMPAEEIVEKDFDFLNSAQLHIGFEKSLNKKLACNSAYGRKRVWEISAWRKEMFLVLV